jgi:hypothetical protein
MRKRPLAIAVAFAHALRRLRDGGRGERAEALRTQSLPALERGVPERGFSATDLLDAFSAPNVPTGTPFGAELP